MKAKERCAFCERIITKKDREEGLFWRSRWTKNYYCCRPDCPSVHARLRKKRGKDMIPA